MGSIIFQEINLNQVDLFYPKLINEIHLFALNLNQPKQVVSKIIKILNKSELEQLDEFFFEKDKNQYLITRSYLKKIIGNYFRVDPLDLNIMEKKYSVPNVIFPKNVNKSAGICYSISHSHELALFAFTVNRKVGVDVEYFSRKIDYDSIARHFFSGKVLNYLNNLSGLKKKKAFLELWVAREAIIKALGDQRKIDFNQFMDKLEVEKTSYVINLVDKLKNIHNISIRLFNVNNYIGSIVSQESDWIPKYYFIV